MKLWKQYHNTKSCKTKWYENDDTTFSVCKKKIQRGDVNNVDILLIISTVIS